jgi:hypothetical protein
MQKSVLERFISKYSLGGAADSVLWKSDGKHVEVTCISDDKNVLAKISTKDITIPEGEYGVFNTAQLNSLLGVLEDTVNLNLKVSKGKPMAFALSDTSTKVDFVLSEPTVIPPAPGLKQLPPFDLEIPVDKKFMDTFVRAKGALPDVETFTVLCNKSVPQIVIGYSDMNTNRVTIEVEHKEDYPTLQPINFSARFMKEVLTANREAKVGTMKISSKGLAHLTFDLSDFTVNYYLVQIQSASI